MYELGGFCSGRCCSVRLTPVGIDDVKKPRFAGFFLDGFLKRLPSESGADSGLGSGSGLCPIAAPLSVETLILRRWDVGFPIAKGIIHTNPYLSPSLGNGWDGV